MSKSKAKKVANSKPKMEKGSEPGSVVMHYVEKSGDVKSVEVWMVPKLKKAFSTRDGRHFDIGNLFPTVEQAQKASEKSYVAWRVHRYHETEVEQIYITWYNGRLKITERGRFGSYVNRSDREIFLTEREAVLAALKNAKGRVIDKTKQLEGVKKSVEALEKRLGKLKVNPKAPTIRDFIEAKGKLKEKLEKAAKEPEPEYDDVDD